MSNNYKIKSGVSCTDTIVVEYLKSLLSTIKVDEIQELKEKVNALEEKLTNAEEYKNKYELLTAKIDDVYNRTKDYNNGRILYNSQSVDMPETLIIDLKNLNDRVDGKKLSIIGENIDDWSDERLYEGEDLDADIERETGTNGLPDFESKILEIEGKVDSHNTQLCTHDEKIGDLSSAQEMISDQVTDINANLNLIREDIATNKSDIENLKKSSEILSSSIDGLFVGEKLINDNLDLIREDIENLKNSKADKSDVATSVDFDRLSDKLEDVYFRTQNYDNGIVLYEQDNEIKGFNLVIVANAIGDSLINNVEPAETCDWYEIRKDNDLYQAVMNQAGYSEPINKTIEEQLEEKADKSEILTQEALQVVSDKLEDVYLRTQNYDRGRLLYVDPVSQVRYGTNLINVANIIDQTLSIRIDNPSIDWSSIEKDESKYQQIIEQLSYIDYGTNTITHSLQQKADKSEIVSQEALQVVSEKLEDVYDRTKNYDNGRLLFADTDMPRGISLEKLIDYIGESILAPIVSTTDTDWGMIRKNEALYKEVLLECDDHNFPMPMSIQGQLYEKLDKQLEQNLTLYVCNATGAVLDTVDTHDVERFIREALTDSGKNILGNAATQAGMLTIENQTKTNQINSLLGKDTTIEATLGNLDARITALEEKVVV